MDIYELEHQEGLRFTWNAWPGSRIEASRSIIPLAAMWTPLPSSGGAELLLASHTPLQCRRCNAVLNPYCQVDYDRKNWLCVLCSQRNHFPASYFEASATNLPVECHPSHSSIEYALSPTFAGLPPAFLLVIDLCQLADDLQQLKHLLLQTLTSLPDYCLLGLVSYGAMVHVHEIGHTSFPKTYMFRGDQDLAQDQVRDQLELNASWQQASHVPPGVGRFLVPLGEFEFALTSLIEELSPDRQPGKRASCRATRASGVALSVATSLLATCVPHSPARIMHFAAGPATEGPGTIVDADLADSIRTHHDIVTDNTTHYRTSSRFYASLAQRLVESGHAMDLFAASLDQVGAAEMCKAVERTGGMMVLAEAFDSEQFQKSVKKFFGMNSQGGLEMCFEGVVEVVTGPGVRVTGAIGPMSNTRKKSESVSQTTELGLGGSCQWKIPSLWRGTCIAFYFEVVGQLTGAHQFGSSFFIQFLVQYRDSFGQLRLRVTTASRRFLAPSQGPQMGLSFDQEAAICAIARLASLKAETEEVGDILKWLDRTLVRLAVKFGEFQREEPDAFHLTPTLSMFPQFVYNLRRSQFLKVFNNTPDETAFFRLCLNRENVHHSVAMIQPTLLSYTFDGPPVPVSLDVASIQPDCILLFDSFFCVLVHNGSHIAQWRKLNYHQDPSHHGFKRLLEAPVTDGKEMVDSRLPAPRFVVCDQHGSQARFLLAKLNPSSTHLTAVDGGSKDAQVILTDDVSLEAYMTCLKKMAAQGS